MAEPSNVELTQWLRRGAPDAGAPETHKLWCELAASKINSHADLVKALEDLDAVLDFDDENLEPVWTFEDLTSVRAAFKQARAALATLTARKMG